MSFKPFLAYSASAGSGKTFALSVRYISLLFMGESPSTILAATFTKKAAAEMRQRVVDALRGFEENVDFMRAVSQETGLNQEELLSKKEEVLARFLASSAYIVTIDSFFTSILRSASLEIGLEPDFTTKERELETFEAHFLALLEKENLLLTLVQLALGVEDKRFEKIFDILNQLYTIDALLPNTSYIFDDLGEVIKRIEENREKMYQLLQKVGASATAVNNFAPNSLKAFTTKTVFDKTSLLEHRNYKKYVEAHPQIEALFLALKADIVRYFHQKEAQVLHYIFEIYTSYKNSMIEEAKQSGILRFVDLTFFTYRLLYESISREFLYFKMDAKFKHILLDEFQDTSTLQFLLFEPLLEEIFAGVGQSEFKSFFYVGDTKQSLYRFRGGVEELFDKVATKYGIAIEPMSTNYRSSIAVVEQVNRWFRPIVEGYTPQKVRTNAKEGYVEVVESNLEEKEEILLQAIGEAQKLIALGVHSDDIAFLVHTNKDGQLLQTLAQKEGIEVRLKTTSSLKNVPHIVALVSMVSYLFYGDPIDAKAMLTQVGKSIEEVDAKWFTAFLAPYQVLHRLIQDFGYFNNDANLLKLLAFATHYNDIPTFLEEFTQSNEEIASATAHGAQIMTIHGSKGLEFEHVILLDRLTKENHDNSLLLFDYGEELRVEEIYYRQAGRERFDENYHYYKERQKRIAQKDKLNLLYVALTRAVEGLTVVKKEKASIFAPLGLEAMKQGKVDVKQTEKRVSKKTLLPQRNITNYGLQNIKPNNEEEKVDYEALLFGTALHYGLEMLATFTPQSVDDALVAVKNRYGERLGSEQLGQIEKRIKTLVCNESFLNYLKSANVHKEQPFGFHGEQRQIDLLLEYSTHCVVMDYKSSKKYALKHTQQVNAYVEAMQSILKKPTKGVIIYLLEDEVVLQEV
jgi:exodeoxyribonuclease V beta subunit